MDNNKTFERNLKRFRRWLCKNAVARVVNGFLPTFLDDHSKKMRVVIDDSLQPCTDGETIIVSLIPAFLEEDYSEEEWLIALKAATAHEAQHVNSSNFTDVKEVREWYGKYLADTYELDPSIGVTIAGKVQNIVEDGRIERIAVERRPGMYKPFLFLNEAIRDGTTIAGKSDTPAGEYRDFLGNVLSYAKTGECSPGAEVYAGTRMENVYLGIQSLIDDGIASNSSSDCREYIQELLEDASPYLVDLIKSDPELEKSLKENELKDEYTSNAGQPAQSNGTQPGGNPLRKKAGSSGNSSGQDPQQGSPGKQQSDKGAHAPEAGNEDSSDSEKDSRQGKSSLSNQGGDSGDTGADSGQSGKSDSLGDPKSEQSPTGFSASEDRKDPLSSDELNELKEQMERELTSANSAEAASKKQSDPNAPSDKDIESIRGSYSGRTLPVKYRSVPISCISELPPDLKAQALSLHREITRIKEARNRSHKGLRRGMLDTGALWKTGLRDDTIFSRKGNPDSGSIVFYLLIDNSGSMAESTSGDRSGIRKYQAARFAAAVVEEAVRGLVPCKIALFDQTSSCVNHQIIRDFDEKKSENCSWNSLSAVGPGGCNTDSVNIRISSLELSRRPERRKVLFVLSDGEPSAYGSRAEGQAEVRQAVLEARRKGLIVIPVMFGNEGFLCSSKSSYELMYEKNIIACAPQEITPRLCALFRQVICR